LFRIYTLLMRQIAVHTLVAAGRFATDQTHVHPHKRNAIEREGDYPQERCKLIGPPSRAWSAAIYGHRGPIGIRVLPGAAPTCPQACGWPTRTSQREGRAPLGLAMAASAPAAGAGRPGRAGRFSLGTRTDPRSQRPTASTDFPLHHEPTHHDLKITQSLRYGHHPGSLTAGGRRLPAQPAGVPGTDPPGRNQPASSEAQRAARPLGGVHPTQNEGGI
jgi:hypothetical protein